MSGKFGKSIKLINSFQKLNKQNRSSEFVWRINFQEQKLQKIILKISSTALFLFFKKIFYETLQSPSRQFFFLIYFQLTVNSSLTLSQYNQSLENVFSQMLAIKMVAENISISPSYCFCQKVIRSAQSPPLSPPSHLRVHFIFK